MDAAKIRLSPEEVALVGSAGIILTKNRIMEKAKSMLETLVPMQQQLLSSHADSLPAGAASFNYKISRGENYKGLPYLILDHPRIFLADNIFAIRTFFWWGHFFSTTLHVSGEYKTRIEPAILRSYDRLRQEDFFLCINDDPWQHHFETINYLPLQGMSQAEARNAIQERPFMKLSAKLPVTGWDEMPVYMLGKFRTLLESLGG